MIQVHPLTAQNIPEAAALFIQNYRQQRQVTPCLPGKMQDQPRIEQMLETMAAQSRALAAVEAGRLVGYLSWFLVDQFRGAERKGAYVPEWGHAVQSRDKIAVYQALYRLAGECWAEAGCQVHAVSLLAHDRAAGQAWYWNGFGLTVVDAVRPALPLQQVFDCPLTIRKAAPADAAVLAEIDAEHWQHYSRSPIFMPPHAGNDAGANTRFLQRPKNSAWLAEDQGKVAGFIRFEGYDFDGVASLQGEDGVIITGAYIRPAYRRRGAAAALLDAALRDYQACGVSYCAVTFESFNPEASAFWPRYFEPVCYSLLRVPEYVANQPLR